MLVDEMQAGEAGTGITPMKVNGCALTLLAGAAALQVGVPPALSSSHRRVPAALMQQQSVSQPSEVEPLAAAAGETNVVGAEVEQTNERFTPITLQSLDTWAEKFPRLQDKLADIKMSSLIFPFKASPYLVEELVRHSAPSRSPAARLRPGAARPRAAD